MIRIFKTTDSGIRKVAVAEEGCWIALTNPTAEELSTTADQFNIDVDDLKSPLDEEERSRIQVEENYTLIILDIPTIEERKGREYFYTIPFGIIFTDKYIFTVCLVDSPVLTVFMDGRVRDFYTYKRTRFIYQMLYRNATMFLQYLKIIDKKSDEVEKKLHISQRNQELIEMLDLEKSLVYFTTSLRGNEVVLEKLMRNTSIPRYEDDEELLDHSGRAGPPARCHGDRGRHSPTPAPVHPPGGCPPWRAAVLPRPWRRPMQSPAPAHRTPPPSLFSGAR